VDAPGLVQGVFPAYPVSPFEPPLSMVDHRQDSSDGSGVAERPSFPKMNLRVQPNPICCNAMLAAFARAKPPQWKLASPPSTRQ